jgi:type I restriction enzyme M protein
MTNDYKIPEEIISMGEREGLIKLSEDKVEYISLKKSYRSTDPEERVRAAFYVELITKYKYPKEKIDLEVIVPRRDPKDKADIVVYEDDDKKSPYIVVECKKDGIPLAEIKQAVEQAFGNTNSLGAKYALMVAGNVRIAFDVAKFPPMEREKNVIADIPIRYGKLTKFKFKKGDENWDVKEVTRDELLNKFQQCHDTLWEGGRRNPAEAFDEMSKLMFCKIHDERFLTPKGEYYKFQVGTHETINEVAGRIKNIYQDAQGIDPDVFIDPVKAEDPITYGVVEVLQGVSLSKTDLDAKGVAFEHFLGTVFRGEMGQYFTPRAIVEFMVDFLEPDIHDLVIDPACGSGGFLIYALEKVKNDLEARLEPHDARDRWKDFALKQVFGIEINNQLARVSMMNMIIHEDGHTNIENNDALDNPTKFHPRRDVKLDKFTLLLTNPPFGAVVKDRERTYLKDYFLGGKEKKRNRQNTEILFIERCLDYLRPGGRMGIVLPDGILTNSTLQYVRDFVLEKAQILGVVSLPQGAFTHYGAGVKASLLFLRKKEEDEILSQNYPIFMAIARHIGYDTTGRPDKNEFPEILEVWRDFKKDNRVDFFANAPLCFALGRGEIESRFDSFYHKPEFRKLHKIAEQREASTLAEIAIKMVDGPFGSQLLRKDYVEKGIPFLRVQNVKENYIDLNDIVYINQEAHERIKRSAFKPGDIVITKTGWLGIAAVLPKTFLEWNIRGDLAGIRLKSDINPYYAVIFLNSKFGRNLISQQASGSTRPRVILKNLKKVPILFPPRQIQDKIVSLMDEAYRVKKEKETDAERILNSIEEYVLKKLDIKLPKITDERTFTVTAAALKGGRFDPFGYQPQYVLLGKAMDKAKYPIATLEELLVSIVNGLDARKFIETGTKYLRVSNIKPDEIDETDIKFVGLTLDGITKDIRLKPEDVLLTRKGTFGTSAVIKDKVDYIISSEIMRLRFKKGINPFFFSLINNCSFVQEQYKQKAVGAIMGSLSQEVIGTIRFPFPPPLVQEKIAQEVQLRRQRAKKLKEEAQEVLQKAKEKAEQMILGEEIA